MSVEELAWSDLHSLNSSPGISLTWPSSQTTTGVPVCLARWIIFFAACRKAASAFEDNGMSCTFFRSWNYTSAPHQVVGDKGLAARHIHPELVDCQEIISLRVFEIDHPCCPVTAARCFPVPRYKNAVYKEIKYRLVGFHQLGHADPLQAADDLAHPFIIQPRLAMFIQIDCLQRGLQAVSE